VSRDQDGYRFNAYNDNNDITSESYQSAQDDIKILVEGAGYVAPTNTVGTYITSVYPDDETYDVASR